MQNETHPAECTCCTFEQCLQATCLHPEHQRRGWGEQEGEHPENRKLRRMIYEAQLTPVELACMGIV